MNSSNEKETRLKKSLVLFISLVTVVFGIHGLNSYYIDLIPNIWRRISVILYGLLQLFLFSSPISDRAHTTWTYEFAKWVAPVLTSALVLTTIILFFRHHWNVLRNRFGKHIIIVGYSNTTKYLIQNLRADKKDYRISLLALKPLPLEVERDLEKKQVAVHFENLVQATRNDLRFLSYKLRLDHTKLLVLSDDEEMNVFTNAIKLLNIVNPTTKMTWYIELKSDVLQGYLLTAQESTAINNKKTRQIDIVFYDTSDLEVESLLQTTEILQHQLAIFENKKFNLDVLSPEIINTEIGVPHLLIYGQNKFTDALINRCGNDLVVNLTDKMIVTQFCSFKDDDIGTTINPNLYLCVDHRIHYLGKGKDSVDSMVNDLESGSNPPTCILLADDNALKNLKMFSYLEDKLAPVPVLFRNKENHHFGNIFDHYSRQVILFGSHSQFITPDVVLNEKLNQSAVDFNEAYNMAAKMSGLSGGSGWHELSRIKKESSKASANHARTKIAIIKAIYGSNNYDEDTLIKKLSEGIDWLKNAQRQYQGEKFQSELTAYLKSEPIIDFLTQLEHKRWCNSYYLMGFVHGPTKDEKNKTHPCLIEEWSRIVTDQFMTCQPQYDLISVFALRKILTSSDSKKIQ